MVADGMLIIPMGLLSWEALQSRTFVLTVGSYSSELPQTWSQDWTTHCTAWILPNVTGE